MSKVTVALRVYHTELVKTQLENNPIEKVIRGMVPQLFQDLAITEFTVENKLESSYVVISGESSHSYNITGIILDAEQYKHPLNKSRLPISMKKTLIGLYGIYECDKLDDFLKRLDDKVQTTLPLVIHEMLTDGYHVINSSIITISKQVIEMLNDVIMRPGVRIPGYTEFSFEDGNHYMLGDGFYIGHHKENNVVKKKTLSVVQ